MEVSSSLRVNVKEEDIKSVFTEEYIVQKLHGEEMEPHKPFKDYFKDELDNKNFVVSNIHIITIIPATGSMHEPLFLPLRLLNDSDSINIGKNMKLFDDDVHPYFRISIADVGGYVITLEYYYDRFQDQLSKRTEEIKGTRSGKTINSSL
ncbi:hypothetical protein RhiirA4_460508 [Rhizophagus irregularis]|uniref:Uncharacterized protein n=1 Tax=Rhizophagus irregularis TaxID=588596 RepID=A0A2I1GGR3_9GLOM|nr:hypothetical protein RhiirA4_460508 [Rhizophagus irregularis]